MEYSRFSDFAKEDRHFEGPKKRIEEILNLEILFIGYKIGTSKYNKGKAEDAKYLQIQIEIDEEKFVVFTGSQVLSEQMEKYKDKLPFLAKVIKVDKYYSLS